MCFLSCFSCCVRDPQSQFEIGDYYEKKAWKLLGQASCRYYENQWVGASGISKKIEKIYGKALENYKKAAQQGHEEAKFVFAWICYTYADFNKEMPLASRYLKQDNSSRANELRAKQRTSIFKCVMKYTYSHNEFLSNSAKWQKEHREWDEEIARQKAEKQEKYDLEHPEETLLKKILLEKQEQTRKINEQTGLLQSINYSVQYSAVH